MEMSTKVRMPAILVPSFIVIMKTSEGRCAEKRIQVHCGVCNQVRYYSVYRGITRISSVVACEQCRHCYQKFKKSPSQVICLDQVYGRCFRENTFMTSRCKGCWILQIIEKCPHPAEIYNSLASHLDIRYRTLSRGRPMTDHEMNETYKGSLALHILRNDKWVDVTIREDDFADKSQSMYQEDEEVDIESISTENGKLIETLQGTVKYIEDDSIRAIKEATKLIDSLNLPDIDLDDDELTVDDPMPMEEDDSSLKVPEPQVPKNTIYTERGKRKVKRVNYCTKPGNTRKKLQVHGLTGALVRTGKDLCDCLQSECVGCHFPCPKCRSPKCGNECRVNRAWYYEKVDVEGSKVFWINKYAP